jgi:release factor glutamine methyltransferase
VSNPPYIRRDELAQLAPEVSGHDPAVALDGGPDGLEFYRRIGALAPNIAVDAGWVVVEVGYQQAAEVARIMAEAFAGALRRRADIAGHVRCVAGRLQHVA